MRYVLLSKTLISETEIFPKPKYPLLFDQKGIEEKWEGFAQVRLLTVTATPNSHEYWNFICFFNYISSMKIADNQILNQIKKIILEQEPKAKIYLYGSRSRGTAKSYSDWDLLILLNKDEITPEEEQKISDPLYDLEFETGDVISPMIYSEKEWNTKYKITPFYKNVMREGRLL